MGSVHVAFPNCSAVTGSESSCATVKTSVAFDLENFTFGRGSRDSPSVVTSDLSIMTIHNFKAPGSLILLYVWFVYHPSCLKMLRVIREGQFSYNHFVISQSV